MNLDSYGNRQLADHSEAIRKCYNIAQSRLKQIGRHVSSLPQSTAAAEDLGLKNLPACQTQMREFKMIKNKFILGCLGFQILTAATGAYAAPILHIFKAAIADTSNEAYDIAISTADRQASDDCTSLGFLGKPADVSSGVQGNAYPVNGGRQWYAEWSADYQCTEPAPVSDSIVISEGKGRALSSMPAAQSLARSRALIDAKKQCRAEFELSGMPTVNTVLTDSTECPGDRYCYATYIAQYNCW